MSETLYTPVFLAVFDEPTSPPLHELALTRGWHVFLQPTPRQILVAMRKQHARLLVFQIGPALLPQAVALLGVLQSYWNRTTVIATSAADNPTVEAAVRQAHDGLPVASLEGARGIPLERERWRRLDRRLVRGRRLRIRDDTFPECQRQRVTGLRMRGGRFDVPEPML